MHVTYEYKRENNIMDTTTIVNLITNEYYSSIYYIETSSLISNISTDPLLNAVIKHWNLLIALILNV